MKPDIEIEKSVNIQNINNIAEKAGIKSEEIIPCGDYKAKISLDIIKRIKGNKNEANNLSHHNLNTHSYLDNRPAFRQDSTKSLTISPFPSRQAACFNP